MRRGESPEALWQGSLAWTTVNNKRDPISNKVALRIDHFRLYYDLHVLYGTYIHTYEHVSHINIYTYKIFFKRTEKVEKGPEVMSVF